MFGENTSIFGEIDSENHFAYGNSLQSEVANLMKALTAGSSANPGAMGTSGNTLQVESLEMQLLDALEQRPQDFKLMKKMYKNPVGSTVHQYTVATDSGSYEGIFTSELATPRETDSVLGRRTRNIKFMETLRTVSLQALRLDPVVQSAEQLEQEKGTHVLLKGAEYGCFWGNETVSPNQFDGFPMQIRNSDNTPNILDMAGKRVSSADGQRIFEEAVRTIWQRGGEATDTFYPGILAQDFQDLVRDRRRFGVNDQTMGLVIEDYPTVYDSTVKIAGPAGPDKLFRVKIAPTASIDTENRPTAPTFSLGVQSVTGSPGFLAATEGTYRYTVYAVDSWGLISAAATPANVAVAAGQEVVVTITRGATNNTGFIVCRGKKDVTTGTDLREMERVASAGATTTYIDDNNELPGTAEMLVLSSGTSNVDRTYQWDSFADLMRFDLGRINAGVRFLMIWYGTCDMKIPERNALIKNVGHADIDWF